MASHAANFGRASALPLSAVLGAIPSYPRPVIERLVARLIDHLDEADGDLDIEWNGDELDAAIGEDDPIFCGYGSDCGKGQLSYDAVRDCEDAEDDDPAELEDDGGDGSYAIDQRLIAHWGGEWRDA